MTNITNKKRAKLHLKTLEDKLAYYKQIVFSSSEAIIIQDFKGIIKAWNKAAERIYGFRAKEMLGKNITKIIAKEDRAMAIKNINSIKQGKPSFRIRQTRIAKNGHKVFVNITYSPIYEAEEIIEIGTTEEDVSELKKSLEGLKESEGNFRKIFENSAVGVAVVGLDGKWQKVNAALCKITGYNEKELLTKAYLQITHPDDVQKTKEFNKKFILGKITEGTIEKRYIHKNGNLIWVSINASLVKNKKGQPQYFIVVTQDITKREKAKEEFITSELKYRRLFETAKDAILIIDADSEKIIDANPFIMQILGYSLKEFIGKKLWEISPFVDIAENKAKFLELQKKKYVHYENLPLKTKKGKEIAVEFVSNVYSVDHTNIIQCNIRDITDRKKAQDKLKESENKFRALVESMNDAVFLADAKTGRIIEVNQAAEKLTGISRNKLIGIDQTQLHPKEDTAKYKKIFQKHLKAGRALEENVLALKKDGTKVPIEISSNVLEINGQKIVQGIFRDITERKKSEQLIEKEQTLSKSIIDSIPGTFYVLNEKGFYVRWNEYQQKKIVGKSADQMTKTNALETIHPDDRALIQTKIANVLIKGKEESVEGRVLMHGGPEFKWFLMTGQRMMVDGKPYLVGTGIDITDRKQFEQNLNEASAKNEAILTSIGDGLIAVNNKRKVVFANTAVEKMLGRNKQKMLGQPLCKIFSAVNEQGNTIPCENRPINKIILSQDTTASTHSFNSTYYVRKDKTKFPVAITITPIILDGKIIGAVEVFRDITKEKEVDKAKTEFVSLASHQLKTPLTMINWYSEILLDNSLGKVNDEQKKHLKAIYHGGKRLVSLVNAMLNVSRIELGTFVVKPKPTNVADLAYSVINELDHELKNKNISLKKDFHKNLPRIPADPKLLRIILQNLLSNATKYTPPKGKISLKMYFAKTGKLVGGKKIATDSLIISVSDNGIGIPQNQQNEIFKKLFRADNARNFNPDGTGLGLYIVKSIINQASGEIWFKSTEKSGTTFCASIPRAGMKKKEGTKFLS